MAQTEADRLETVRKLLAQAESTNFPEEARAFYEKAQTLMVTWAIDDAMLAGASQAQVESIGSTSIVIDANEYREGKLQLLHTLALNNDCRVVRYTGHRYVDDPSKPKGRRRVMDVVMVGFERDRAFVEAVWTSLLMQAEREFLAGPVQAELRAHLDQFPPNHRGGKRIRWHNTFMMGFNSGVSTQLHEAKMRTQAAAEAERGPGVALALRSRREAVDARMGEMFGRLRYGNGSSAGQGSSAAREAGHAAGRRADVGRPRVGGNRPALAADRKERR